MAITSKKINLEQLDIELGGKGLVANFTDPNKKIIKAAEGSDVTDAQIEAAIESHIAGPTSAEIIQLNREQGLAKLKELGFSNDQITALLS